MRKLPDNLKLKQEKTKDETVKTVQKAIDELNAEGYLINIKELINRTGYSRSLFSKPHVQELLKKNEIGKYRNIKKISYQMDEDIYEKVIRLENQLFKTNVKVENLKNGNNDKIAMINDLKLNLKNKAEECEILRGQLHILMQKSKNYGIDFKVKEGAKNV